MKFVQEHCSICAKELAMPVVQEDSGQSGLIWVQCPECKEIKPIEVGRAKDAGNKESRARDPKEKTESKKAGPGRTGPARKVVRHYRAGESFCQGEWIYHPEWDDTGEVIEKCQSKGGHEVIVVSFEKLGKKRLVSNFAR